MHDKRPGGLTALAVINFIFTGFNFLGVAGLAAMLAMQNIAMGAMQSADNPELANAAAMIAEFRGVLIASAVLTGVAAILLLISGIGYLRQKRVTGRMVGSAYAVIAIVSALVSAAVLPADIGGGINIGVVFGLLYPVATLFLVNVTFKDDLVH